jgi:hypothetical protein
MAKRRRPKPSATAIIGGAMVDLEQRIFKSVPRVEILVEQGKDQAGLAADGSGLTVEFPDGPVALPRGE